MFKNHPIFVFVIVLLIVSLACSQSSTVVPTLDPNAAQTAIVETIIALQVQTTPSENPVNATSTLELPTATASLSPTPEPSGTPTTPQISVSFDTFCRLGPGIAYEKVGILLVGETTDIIGRHATGQYWYVRNPDIGIEFCWMSGEYASISGNTAVLLVHTPPPSAPPEVNVFYDGLDKCTGWSPRFRLQNLSGTLFKSISMTVRDTTTNTVEADNTNGFPNTSNCNAPITNEFLIQGSFLMVSAPEFSYNPNNNALSATMIVCTELDLAGTCVTKVVTFTP